MKEFQLSSGTLVAVEEKVIVITRAANGKGAMKAIFTGRQIGSTVIRLQSVSGLILEADHLIICASGLPSPSDFKLSNIADIKKMPNCIIGKAEELGPLNNYLEEVLRNL